jgi:hypothetical protein
MTTYKHCKRCKKIVEFVSSEPTRLSNATVYPITCFGGNRIELCGEIGQAQEAEQ